MATSRIAASLLLRTSRSCTSHTARQFRRVLPNHSPYSLNPAITHFKAYSTTKPSKIYTFADIQRFSETPSKDRVLIDTREPDELRSTGTIPTSINIPVKSQPDAFYITEEEFADRFGVERPAKETEVVFYCRAGVRSRAAAELARQGGWEKVSEYSGSWLDWEKNGGKTESV